MATTIDVFDAVTIIESLRPIPAEEHLWVRAVGHERPFTDTFVKSDSYLGQFSKIGTLGGAGDSNVTVCGEFDFSREISNPSDPAWTSAADEASILVVFRQTLVRSINVSETFVVTEDITVSYVGTFVIADDTVTLTEVVNVLVPFIAMDAAESVTIAENLEQVVKLDLDKADSITTTDDSTTIAVLMPVMDDTLTTTDDSTTLLPFLVISDFELTTLDEAITISTGNIPFSNLVEDISITELVTLFLDKLTTDQSDSVTVAEDILLSSAFLIDVHENVSTFETPDLLLAFLVPSVDDSITLADDATITTPSITRFIDTFDSITATDVLVSLNQSISVDISDTITTADTTTVSQFTKTLYVEQGDNVNTTELIDFPGGVNFGIGGITEITVVIDAEGPS